jgi:hypothetical protein
MVDTEMTDIGFATCAMAMLLLMLLALSSSAGISLTAIAIGWCFAVGLLLGWSMLPD